MEIIRPFLYFSARSLRFFMPKENVARSPHPHIPALRSRDRNSSGQSLGDWATSMLAFHSSPESVAEWSIIAIHWFKNKTRLEHEYLVFTVQWALDSQVLLYLRFDRRSSPEALDVSKGEAVVALETYTSLTKGQQKQVMKSINHEREALLEKRMKGIVRSSKASSRKDGGFEPEDTIIRSAHLHGVDSRDSDTVELLATYSNFRRPFPLRDLAVIGQAVVETADAYLLLVQQCYWLARTMVGISVAKYHPQPEAGVREAAFTRAGRLSRLPFIPQVNTDNPTEIAALIDKVDQEIEKDDMRVQAEYMNGEGGRVAAEKARVEAEKARVEAEKARVEAERARVAAEEALAKERDRACVLEAQLAAYTHIQYSSP